MNATGGHLYPTLPLKVDSGFYIYSVCVSGKRTHDLGVAVPIPVKPQESYVQNTRERHGDKMEKMIHKPISFKSCNSLFFYLHSHTLCHSGYLDTQKGLRIIRCQNSL